VLLRLLDTLGVLECFMKRASSWIRSGSRLVRGRIMSKVGMVPPFFHARINPRSRKKTGTSPFQYHSTINFPQRNLSPITDWAFMEGVEPNFGRRKGRKPKLQPPFEASAQAQSSIPASCQWFGALLQVHDTTAHPIHFTRWMLDAPPKTAKGH
jgi:hypothetical protein